MGPSYVFCVCIHRDFSNCSEIFQIDEYGSSETIRIKEIKVLLIMVSATIITEIKLFYFNWLEVDQGFSKQNRNTK